MDGDDAAGMDGLRTATANDADQMAEVLADAFTDDPVFAWFFPDLSARPRLLQAMFAMLGEHLYLPLGQSVFSDDAAAFWEPPGAAIGDGFWDEHGEAFARALEGQVERVSALGAVMAEHHPPEPCWYLPMIGVRPGAQGHGLGGQLLAHTLEQVDAAGEAAYLEASSPRNRVLYERHGFVATGEMSALDGPPLVAMWREPR